MNVEQIEAAKRLINSSVSEFKIDHITLSDCGEMMDLYYQDQLVGHLSLEAYENLMKEVFNADIK